MNYDFLRNIDLNLDRPAGRTTGVPPTNAAPSGALANTQNWVYGDNQPRPNFTRGRPEPLPRQKLLGHNGYTEFREKPPEAPQPPKYTEKVTNPNVGPKGSAEAKAFSEGYSNQSMQGDPTKNKPAQRVDVASKSLRDRVVGSADDWAKFGNNAVGNMSKAASAAYKPVAALGRGALKAAPVAGAAMGVYEGADAYKRGDKSDMAWAAGDVAASAAMFTPAMPLAATYLGARTAFEGGKALYDYAKQPKAGSAVEMPKVEAMQQQQPAQTATLRDPYADANAAMIARANAENPDLAGGKVSVKAGTTRNTDDFGNLLDPKMEQVYAGPGRGWETRSSELGNRERLRKDQEYKELYERNYAEATRDGGVFARQLRHSDEMKHRDYMNSLQEQASWGNKRAAKQYATLRGLDATIQDARMTRESALRSQNLTERGQNITLMRDQMANQRNLEQDGVKNQLDGLKIQLDGQKANDERSKAGFSQRQEEIKNMFPDDPQKQSEYQSFLNNYIAGKAAEYQKRGDHVSANRVLRGDYQLDAQDREDIQSSWGVKEAAEKFDGNFPGTGRSVKSLRPSDYAPVGVKKNWLGLGGGKVVTANGSEIPINDMRDKPLIGHPGSSVYDKYIEQAQAMQARKDAIKNAASGIYK